MLKHPLALSLALRYIRARKRGQFVSFIAAASLIGIALGVMVLITVLSVMNGFDYEIRHKLFNLADQVLIINSEHHIQNWQQLSNDALKQKDVVAAAPLIRAQGLLTRNSQSTPVLIQGILPQPEEKVSDLAKNMVVGGFNSLQPGSYQIVVGEGLAQGLGLQIGTQVVLVTPQANASPVGIIPRYRVFTVSGIYRVSGDTFLNENTAFIALKDAQTLYQYGNSVSAIRLRVTDLYSAPLVATNLNQALPETFFASDWTQKYGTFFKAIAMEKTMMFIILLLIVGIAAFNLVSTLVMVVNDKRSDIAILRTMGATPNFIMRVFMLQGFIIGSLGTFFGIIFGVLLALNVTAVVNFIQKVFGVQFVSSSVYFIDYVPSQLQWMDIVHIALAALMLSFLATIYPARSAAKTQPAEALRYE